MKIRLSPPGLPGLAAFAVAAIVSANTVRAAEPDAAGEERAVTFQVGTGVEYDSNVAVLELDSTSDASDRVMLLDFGLGYDRPTAGRFDIKAGYDFSQTLHQQFDDFDVRIHRGSATLSYDLDRVDIGTVLQYADAELDGNGFLTLTQVSPYVSKLVGKRLFLRFAYARTDKSFAGDSARNATADSLSADQYVFLNGLTTYLVFGYRYDHEDAVAGELDYAGHKLTAQWSHRLPAGVREITLKSYLRYETRDYTRPTPAIGAPRQDDRLQIEVAAELPLTQHVRAKLGYQHSDNRSNLRSVDFDEDVLSLSFSARL